MCLRNTSSGRFACEAVSVEKGARCPPLQADVVCPPGGCRRRRLAITADSSVSLACAGSHDLRDSQGPLLPPGCMQTFSVHDRLWIHDICIKQHVAHVKVKHREAKGSVDVHFGHWTRGALGCRDPVAADATVPASSTSMTTMCSTTVPPNNMQSSSASSLWNARFMPRASSTGLRGFVPVLTLMMMISGFYSQNGRGPTPKCSR